jgi:hypothetical protein
MFQMFYNLAKAGGLQLTRIGELKGGLRVFALAESKEIADVSEGDNVQLCALLTSGHVPGMAYTLKLFVQRLVCANGMTVSERAAQFRMSHRTRFNDQHRERMERALESGSHKFGEYMDSARAMFQVVFPHNLQRDFITEVYQPGTLASLIKDSDGLPYHKAALERVAGRSEQEQSRAALKAAREWGAVPVPDAAIGRNTRHALWGIYRQPNTGVGQDTLWNAVNAVTFHVDHVRGRSNDSGVEAAYFGAGEQTKNRANALAHTVLDTVEQDGVFVTQ